MKIMSQNFDEMVLLMVACFVNGLVCKEMLIAGYKSFTFPSSKQFHSFQVSKFGFGEVFGVGDKINMENHKPITHFNCGSSKRDYQSS